MINNNNFFSSFSKIIRKYVKNIRKSSQKNKILFQRIQLTFIYFFAIIVLAYSIRNFLGYIPEILLQFIPFLQQLLDIQFLKILAAPEKTFILYLLVLEILINRATFNFSLLVKFNVLLIFILEMIQNLLANYWDLIFGREIDISILNNNMIFIRDANIVFYTLLFLLFLFIYLYCYYRAIKGVFPIFPSFMQSIVDSVAFWLQIKTPNMRFGKDKKKEE